MPNNTVQQSPTKPRASSAHESAIMRYPAYNKHRSKTSLVTTTAFTALPLSAELLANIESLQYTAMTPIQAQALPAIIKGKDVLAQARTGTGKTAAFAIGLLHALEPQTYQTQALVLCPTRELADQVSKEIRQLARAIPNTNILTLCGGKPIGPQLASLERNPHIVVGTPGRILKHLQKASLQLDHLKTLVLDEADRMLDMGFIRDIRKVLKAIPPRRQNLLFSATFSNEIKQLAGELLNAPMEIQVARQNTTVELISQVVHPVDRNRKRELLSHMIGAGNWQQVLVFTRTKHLANRLSQQLEQDGISSAAIHGNKSQGARTRALADFKKGGIRVLVATDIAARGLDIEQLPHVVNFELPNVPEDYIHRIGRTGRAGLDGEAISLVCIDERKLLADIEKLQRCNIEKIIIPGYEPDASIKAEPIKNGGNAGRNSRPNNRGSNNRGRNARTETHRGRGQGQRSRRAA